MTAAQNFSVAKGLVRHELYVLDIDLVYFKPGLFGELAAVLDIRPPFDPEAAVAACAALIKRYGATNTRANGRSRVSASTGSSSFRARGRSRTSIATFCRR
jgi:hypothetical protein